MHGKIKINKYYTNHNNTNHVSERRRRRRQDRQHFWEGRTAANVSVPNIVRNTFYMRSKIDNNTNHVRERVGGDDDDDRTGDTFVGPRTAGSQRFCNGATVRTNQPTHSCKINNNNTNHCACPRRWCSSSEKWGRRRTRRMFPVISFVVVV